LVQCKQDDDKALMEQNTADDLDEDEENDDKIHFEDGY